MKTGLGRTDPVVDLGTGFDLGPAVRRTFVPAAALVDPVLAGLGPVDPDLVGRPVGCRTLDPDHLIADRHLRPCLVVGLGPDPGLVRRVVRVT